MNHQEELIHKITVLEGTCKATEACSKLHKLEVVPRSLLSGPLSNCNSLPKGRLTYRFLLLDGTVKT